MGYQWGYNLLMGLKYGYPKLGNYDSAMDGIFLDHLRSTVRHGTGKERCAMEMAHYLDVQTSW